jgi:hypothetical protein
LRSGRLKAPLAAQKNRRFSDDYLLHAAAQQKYFKDRALIALKSQDIVSSPKIQFILSIHKITEGGSL